MRVLLADKLAPLAVEMLRAGGCTVIEEPSLSGESLTAALREHVPEVLVVRSTKVTEADLSASGPLSLVVRAGAGVNTIDLEAAGRHGVFVSNCPGKNAVAVAELVFGLLVALDRHIADCVADGRVGQWNKGAYSQAKGLKGRTLAVLGLGTIGRAVVARAQAFEMEVVGWSRSLTRAQAEALGIRFAESPVAAAEGADALTVHTALTADTRGLVGGEVLGALADGASVINTARAGVLDEAALLVALEQKGLRAGLDVFEGEPSGKRGPFESVLATHPSVVLTHHLGASTLEAQEAVATEVARVVGAYVETGRAPNCVNLETQTRATHTLVVRHADRVGVLAGVLDALRQADINVQEMENTIFAGGGAAVARIRVSTDPSAVLDVVRALDHVLHVAAVERQPTAGGLP